MLEMSAHVLNPGGLGRTSPSAIAFFREKHGLTQSELGNIVCRSRATVSAWETGATAPDLAAQRLMWAIDSDPQLIRGLARSSVQVEDPAAKVREFVANANCGVDAHPIGDPANGKYLTSQRVARLDVGLDILRAMATEPGDAGGYLVGETTREPVLSPLLGGRLSRLGLVYESLPRPAMDQLTPVTLGLPEAQWLAESDPVTEATPALERHAAYLRYVGCGVAYSRHLATLAGDRTGRLVAQMVRRSLARAVDGAVLTGDGLLQPLGLSAQVPELAVAAIDAAAILDAIEDLEAQGVDSERLAIVAAPSVKRALGVIVHDGRSLWHTRNGAQYVAGVPAVATDLMPDNEVLIGDFAAVTVHHEQDVHLVQRSVGSDDRRETYAFMAAALSVPLPASFVRITVNA